MGADNVLSFDAITAEGKYVTANAKENPDLFWALKGGGPSTFAVVTAITVKTHPEVPTAGTILNINSTHTNDTALFGKAFKIFHNLSNHYANHGIFVYFEQGPGLGRLHIAPFVAPNTTEAELNTILKPLYDQLKAAGVPYDAYTRSFPTFFEFYIDMFEDEGPNQNSIVGGRLFAQSDIEKYGDKIADALLFASMPEPTQIGFNVGHIVNPGHKVPTVDNAIHPTWRNASSFVITNVILGGTESWAVKKERETYNTNVVGKALRDVSPAGAAYVNEVCTPIETTANVLQEANHEGRVICTSRIGRRRTGDQTIRACSSFARSMIPQACSTRRQRLEQRTGACLTLARSCARRLLNRRRFVTI